jgi:hypothetical protein
MTNSQQIIAKKSNRSYYSQSICGFLSQSANEILGIINSNSSSADITKQQNNAWEYEINILKKQLLGFDEGRIVFEYTIPRMGKRVDAVILHSNIVFLLEFKCGEQEYRRVALDQVYDYALDLRNFQKASHHVLLVPILVATEASTYHFERKEYQRIVQPVRCNANSIGKIMIEIKNHYCDETEFDYVKWECSEYLPTPTIIEAAQALYRGHNVSEITRSDAGAENLTVTTNEINKIIEHSKNKRRKSICFVTGVPGAGKTLVGLNIAVERANAQKGEHAVFLSGNYPLVTVLQEALARDKVAQSLHKGMRIHKTSALRSTTAFIQIIHKYRDSFIGNTSVPPERIAIFDEAQRAWTHDMISKFMSTKKGVPDFPFSEPEFLISTMDRHKDWAVIICLIGGGQEINTGEAGLPEWFESLKRGFRDWDVYITPKLNDSEYLRGKYWDNLTRGLILYERKPLHLSTSIRSFRTPYLAAFVKAVLDVEVDQAIRLHEAIREKYPIVLTRNLFTAKQWVKERSKGSTRDGLLASSGALRLKAVGIFVKNKTSVANWFLNDKEDVRSSYALEDVVTEFDIQGLEIDYSIVAWDADFRFDGNQWTYNSFVGSKWQRIHAEERKLYLKNAYRVLLTRARQGMVLYIPEGDDADRTCKKRYYDYTYEYLKQIGILEIY